MKCPVHCYCGIAETVDANSWFSTGELGSLVDGELYVVGRSMDLIIVGDRNVVPTGLGLSGLVRRSSSRWRPSSG